MEAFSDEFEVGFKVFATLDAWAQVVYNPRHL